MVKVYLPPHILNVIENMMAQRMEHEAKQAALRYHEYLQEERCKAQEAAAAAAQKLENEDYWHGRISHKKAACGCVYSSNNRTYCEQLIYPCFEHSRR